MFNEVSNTSAIIGAAAIRRILMCSFPSGNLNSTSNEESNNPKYIPVQRAQVNVSIPPKSNNLFFS